MRISLLPRAILVVRIRGGVRRYNASWLPWVVLAILGWCIFHDHDREYASRYHDHYKISEMEDELRRHDDELRRHDDKLRRHDDKIDELEDGIDKLEDELGRHDHDREYSKRSHDHSEYSWEWHEH